jgi:hypothetical protein
MLNSNDKINVNMDYREIKGRDLIALLDFCFAFCDTVSLCQSQNIGMTREEDDQAGYEYYGFLEENGILEGKRPTFDEMVELYKDIAETEEELQELIRREKESRDKQEAGFKKSDEEVAEYVQSIFGGYQLAGRNVTCMTPCTMGGPCVMYYLKPEENIKARFYEMTDLFQPVITDESTELRLDDPTLYKEGEIVLVVCSHESYASLLLTEEQYEDFKELNIPHELIRKC